MATASPAAAATSGALLIGVDTNVPTALVDDTVLNSPSATDLMPLVLHARNVSAATAAPPAELRVAVAGTTAGASTGGGHKVGIFGAADPGTAGTTEGAGVYGTAGGTVQTPAQRIGVLGTAAQDGWGVYGTHDGSDGIGVHGDSTSGDGVRGSADGQGIGVRGSSLDGPGVVGQSQDWIGMIASSEAYLSLSVEGTGRVFQLLQQAVGPPTVGEHLAGEQLRDSVGDLYLCVAEATGTPGTWRKVAAQHPEYATKGGSMNLLTKPIRIVNTRPASGAPLTNGGVKLAAGSATTFQVTGTTVDGISVPAGARGVIGNLTCAEPTGQGYLTIFPAGQAVPTTSNLNYTTAPVANGFTCALSAGGAVRVFCGQKATNCIIDIVGFLF